MNNSGFCDEEQNNIATNYINGEKGFYMDPSIWFACGDMVSTAHDYYLFDRSVQNGTLLKPQTVKEMQKPHHDGKFVLN